MSDSKDAIAFALGMAIGPNCVSPLYKFFAVSKRDETKASLEATFASLFRGSNDIQKRVRMTSAKKAQFYAELVLQVRLNISSAPANVQTWFGELKPLVDVSLQPCRATQGRASYNDFCLQHAALVAGLALTEPTLRQHQTGSLRRGSLYAGENVGDALSMDAILKLVIAVWAELVPLLQNKIDESSCGHCLCNAGKFERNKRRLEILLANGWTGEWILANSMEAYRESGKADEDSE
jgi:hypothetical protein